MTMAIFAFRRMAVWWKIGLSGFSIIRFAICNSGRDQTTMKIFFPFGIDLNVLPSRGGQ
jgi:hypothetical protein